MLACRFGEHPDNLRNSQGVFLVVYAIKSFVAILAGCAVAIRHCVISMKISQKPYKTIKKYDKIATEKSRHSDNKMRSRNNEK
jgi:uncharacterized membrane protein YjgN (DUF898 family)